jgi:hypothetical protein
LSIVTEIEAQIRRRLEELRPAYDEYRQLEDILSSFEGTATKTAGSAAPRRVTRRRRQVPVDAVRHGGRAVQALALVNSRPGITVADLATELGIGTTYLYRVMPALERAGEVEKRGTGYYPRDAARASGSRGR